VKTVCCDTSFLYSTYAVDVHTARAATLINHLREPLTVSVLNIFELENAVRFAGYRRAISPDQARLVLSTFESDCREGRIATVSVDLSAVLTEARHLSAFHTLHGGHRSFDILLVAAALHLKAHQFLSFDLNQRRLAQAEGLKLNP
jgi:predicted nucleic acid-binding protein